MNCSIDPASLPSTRSILRKLRISLPNFEKRSARLSRLRRFRRCKVSVWPPFFDLLPITPLAHRHRFDGLGIFLAIGLHFWPVGSSSHFKIDTSPVSHLQNDAQRQNCEKFCNVYIPPTSIDWAPIQTIFKPTKQYSPDCLIFSGAIQKNHIRE